MPRQPLSITDIKELDSLLREVFDYIIDLRKKNRLAYNIQYPKIPSILTESLAIHLLNRMGIISKLNGYTFKFGGRVADILAIKGNNKIKIEIKATAKSAFEYFGEKDISADFIIWIHFGNFFVNKEETQIKVFIVQTPRNYFHSPIKITLSRLKQIVNELNPIVVDLNNFLDG